MWRLAVGGLLAAIALAASGCGEAPIPSSVGNGVGVDAARPGKVYAFGVTSFRRYRGRQRAFVVDFRPAKAEEAAGLHLRYGATSGAGMSVGALDRWRPVKWGLHAVAGYAIPRGKYWGIVVGMTAERPGRYLVHEWVLDYVVGGRVYRSHFGPAMGMCVSMPKGCRSLDPIGE